MLFNIFNFRVINKNYKYFIHKNISKLNYIYFSSLYKKSDDRFFNTQSQLSQDFLAALIFDFKRNGTFIEFGATNGIDLSNTYSLEVNLDWSGILIEPVKSYFKELVLNRQNSICYNKIVYNKTGIKKVFNENKEKSLSGLKKKSSDTKKYDVYTISLNDIFLDNNLIHVDFMSIDTEGSEYTILKDFNFKMFSFGLICVEHNYNIIRRKKIAKLLTINGYTRIHKDFSFWDDFYVKNDLTFSKF